MSRSEHVAEFGRHVAQKLKFTGGEPEDQLRAPLEALVGAFAADFGLDDVVLSGEHRLAEQRVRPDYAVYVQGALVGFIEIKAPGTGADPRRFRGPNQKQWERLSCLPNVLYTDGQSFGLFRDGEIAGELAAFDGDLQTAGAALHDPAGAVAAIVDNFLRWFPIPARRPRELARTAARLCQVLRAEVAESMEVESTGLQDLAADWRRYLYPDATDEQFADGYAQTVTFALLLARVEGIELSSADLHTISDELGQHHTLMARALSLLTDAQVLPKLAGSVRTLQRVLGVVDWPTLSKNDPAAWLFFYEEFLQHYDPSLRKKTGSYYTPVEAVRPMVRMVDELLRTRLGQTDGFGSEGVTVVDPAVGTGSFLFGVLERLAETIGADLGPGAVGPALKKAGKRLVGFEIQAGPYAVAELRLATEYLRHGAKLEPDDLRVFLADTLSDPYVEETELPAVYRQIGISRQRANKVKRDEPVMVVLGNPPFKDQSSGRGGWIEQGGHGHQPPLDDWFPPKSSGLGGHAKHLYNLYVYFWRWASWKVFENHPADRGVIAFVSIAGFVNGPGFTEMRADLRRKADAIWVIDCTPEGHQPGVSTRFFAGVQQPICITLAVRDGSTGPDTPAVVRYAALSGSRLEKFATLDTLDLEGEFWSQCPTSWGSAFLPSSKGIWATSPALEDLLAWSGSGTMPGRTWVVGPSRDLLRQRWRHLVDASDDDEKGALLKEHPRDRTVHTSLSDALPGYPTRGSLRDETGDGEEPVRYAARTLDRAWIIPDKRLINRPNPGLWQVRSAPGQLFMTCLARHSPRSGAATSATALVPDLDHYRGSFGGRAFPLWLDRAATQPNVIPGLLRALGSRLGTRVTPEDLFAYIAAVTAHPGYVERFARDLVTPGLRIPLTAVASLWSEAVSIGRRVLWLQTYGERYVDVQEHRPPGPPRVSDGPRPRVEVGIPDTPDEMPEEIAFDEESGVLHVGVTGRVSGVTPAMWGYDTSGYRVISRWFDRRKRVPEGKRSSPLDDVTADRWDADWTRELVDLLHVLRLLTELEEAQAGLLAAIVEGETITVDELTSDGIFPIARRPVVEQPGEASLFS